VAFRARAHGGFAGLIEVLSNRYLRAISSSAAEASHRRHDAPDRVSHEKHMVTIAGTGSGKSTRASFPTSACMRGRCCASIPRGSSPRSRPAAADPAATA